MSHHARFLVLLCTAVFLAAAGCHKPLPNPGTPAPAIKVTGPPVSEAEAKEFAEWISKAVASRDAAAVDRLIGMEDIADRVLNDLDLGTAQRKSYLKGMADTLKQTSVGEQIVKSTEGDGSYKLLRIRSLDGRKRPLFRMITGDGGVNYHEYTLARDKNGKVAVEDLYIYMLGEPISQNLRRSIIPAAAKLRGQDEAAKIAAEEIISSQETIATLAKAVRSGDFESAVAAYRTLPKTSQEQKHILILYMQATMNLGAEGEADYLAAMQLCRQLYSEDPFVDFISLDYLVAKKRFDEARKSIDRLDQAVGGDPYLDVTRGSAWMEEGRFEEARQALEEAIKKEPELAIAYWNRITLSLQEKRHVDTLKWLRIMVEERHIKFNGLKELPRFAEFVKSPQYKEWEEWYAKRSQGKE